MHLSERHLMGLAALLLVGCSADVDSTDVRTSGLFAEFLASSRGDGQVTVEAKLRVGGSGSSTYAELDGDDRLVASLHAETRTMSKTGSSPSSPYRALFLTTTGGTLTIAFERGSLDTSAPDSRIILPDPFTPKFVGLGNGDSAQRGQPISVTWDSVSTGSVSWSLQGPCIKPRSGSVIDEGKLVVRSLDIEPNEQVYDLNVPHALRPEPSCDVGIGLKRGVSGYVDPAFREGGSFQATQSFQLLFRSTPGPDEPKLPGFVEGNSAVDAGALAAVDGGW
jgi:hypothetical protein